MKLRCKNLTQRDSCVLRGSILLLSLYRMTRASVRQCASATILTAARAYVTYILVSLLSCDTIFCVDLRRTEDTVLR